MRMDYKVKMGGKMIPRNDFVKMVKENKDI